MFVKRIGFVAAMTAAVGIVLSLSICVGAQEAAPQAPAAAPAQPLRILYIMSYHSPWEWTDMQLKGFQDALKGVEAEYKTFQLDAKRNTAPEWKEKVGKEACDLVKSWKPSLVYTSDDDAQKLVAVNFLDSDIPFVCSAVNASPETYGFDKAKNMAGVLEEEHSVQSVELLRQICPDVKRIAVITDDAAMWPPVIARMKAKFPKELPDVELVSFDVVDTFAEFQLKVKEYCGGKADAIGFLGVFNFKDEKGNNVPLEEVTRWVAENGTLPDFSFWKDRIPKGTLCAMTVSAFDQGKAAGEIAKGILVDGKSPKDFQFKPTLKGEPVISLARAKKLGIPVKTDVLLAAEVVNEFEWEAKK